MSAPEAVELETGENPDGSVIWLHGLGADGHDFEAIVPELHLPDTLRLRFVFPHAPMRPVTINGGMTMRAWYDVLSLEREGPVDEAGIRDSAAMLETLISSEKERGIETGKIVVAGFSQGGAIAMHTALRSTRKLAGLMALSTYLPLSSYFQAEVIDEASAGDKALPIFMAHGTFDPMLPRQAGRDTADLLQASGFEIEWHEYPMAHAVCAEEITDIRNWLLSVFEN